MTERPIVFSAPMVQAILAGRKTQTRRIIKKPAALDALAVFGPTMLLQPGCADLLPFAPGDRLWVKETCRAEELSYPPSARPATRKEKALYGRRLVTVLDEMDGADGVRYLADQSWRRIENTHDAGERWSEMYHSGRGGKHGVGSTISPRLMPRWASRLTLLVTEVRVQRLQGISEEDAIAEGIELHRLMGAQGWVNYHDKPGDMTRRYFADPRRSFRSLWESLHGPGSWEANPWVAAISFEVARR